MSEELTESQCVPCQGGVDPMTPDEIADYLPQAANWQHVSRDGVDMLRREFTFKDYGGAVEFTNAVAQLAEREDHHPEITLEWGKVTVTWWTHKISGLHLNDFITAAKTNVIYKV